MSDDIFKADSPSDAIARVEKKVEELSEQLREAKERISKLEGSARKEPKAAVKEENKEPIADGEGNGGILKDVSTPIPSASEAEIIAFNEVEKLLAGEGYNVSKLQIIKSYSVTQFVYLIIDTISYIKTDALCEKIKNKLGCGRVRMERRDECSYVVEIPNKNKGTLALKDIVESRMFEEAYSPLTFAIGRGMNGRAVIGDLKELSNLSVAGAAGGGKSTFIDSLIASIMCKSSPKDVRLIIVDFNGKLSRYDGVPFLISPKKVITDTPGAMQAVDWLMKVMRERHNRLGKFGAKTVEDFNSLSDAVLGKYERMPRIVFVLTETDVFLRECEYAKTALTLLLARGAEAGIHLVLGATVAQPSDFPDRLLPNIPARIVLATATEAQALCLESSGEARKLLGRGDLLFMPNKNSKPVRAQGAYVSEADSARLVEYAGKTFPEQNTEEKSLNLNIPFEQDVYETLSEEKAEQPKENSPKEKEETAQPTPSKKEDEPKKKPPEEKKEQPQDKPAVDSGETFDSLILSASRAALTEGVKTIGASWLQRRFGVGTVRASKILEQMARLRFIAGCAGECKLLITEELFEFVFGEKP